MKPVRLGRSGLWVSPLCLGTMMFGTQTSLQDARSIADMALEQGVFFWDTADMYGRGASEEVCRALLKGRRQEVVLASKVFAPMGDGPNDRGGDGGAFSRSQRRVNLRRMRWLHGTR